MGCSPRLIVRRGSVPDTVDEVVLKKYSVRSADPDTLYGPKVPATLPL